MKIKMTIKKYLTFILATITIMILSTHSAFGMAQEVRMMETTADADEWIRVFFGEDPGSLEGKWAMTDQMSAAAAQLGGMKGMAASLAQLGSLEEASPAYEGKIQGYKAFFVPCVFSAMSVDIILVVENGAIAGISTGLYSGAKEAETEALPADFDSIDLSLPVPSLDGELPGTLTLPKGDGPFPAVVLVHGSGPNDRDETIAGLKPFRDLAEGLASDGIAVYRFDKRTYVYGEQMQDDHEITLEDETIEDAVNAVQLLATQEKIDPDRIFVLGHSLGGNAVPAIARELEQAQVKACGFIMMAASPRPLDELIREQYDFLYSLMSEVTEEQQAEKDELFHELDRLQDPDSLTDDDMILGAYAPYWKWLAQYDILAAADEITRPCLLLQGEEDYQVTMEDFTMWKEAFEDKENWQMISYPGLTHPFTPGQKTEGAAAYSRNEKVDEQVIADIAAFVGRSLPLQAEVQENDTEHTAREIIEKLAVYYGTYGSEAEQETSDLLEDLASIDPVLGEKWSSIMNLWKATGTDLPIHADILPDGLPETDELCLVVLGFQLNPDGSMKDELIERLNVALASAEKYPNALVVCTGGGTASENKSATEAGKMAEWLIENGVDPQRVIVEDQSLTTAQNAIFTYQILTEQYPQVKEMAIISSDYHIPTGVLLFEAEAILQAEEPGKEAFAVVSNAAYPAPSGTLSPMFQAGALIELSGDVETAFDIYYETYDIHELPALAG